MYVIYIEVFYITLWHINFNDNFSFIYTLFPENYNIYLIKLLLSKWRIILHTYLENLKHSSYNGEQTVIHA